VVAPGGVFGTTEFGGGTVCNPEGLGCGTVFHINLATGVERVLYHFNTDGTGGLDGAFPVGRVVVIQRAIYGVTSAGGSPQGTLCCGTVFKIDAVTGAETILHSFTGGADGGTPRSGLTLSAGMLYGTASMGGTGYGAVFQVNPADGAFSVVYTFTGSAGGATPYGGLFAKNGRLYGTTTVGGDGGVGTVFRLTP